MHQTKQQLQAQLDFAMGGRAAQEIAFQGAGVTVGARGDFRQASRLARAMVTEYGMSEKLGMLSYGPAKCLLQNWMLAASTISNGAHIVIYC